MRPYCVKCKCEMDLKKGGATVVELFSNPPRPYQLWSADLFECPGCGVQIIDRYAEEPFARHYHSNFLRAVDVADQDGRAFYCYETPQVEDEDA